MDSKPWYASKTIWANLIALVAALATAAGLDLGLDAETQATIVAGVMAVVNVALRVVTARPIVRGRASGIAIVVGLASLGLAGCSGSADLLRLGAQQVQPTFREVKAETGSQDNTIFTMQALGCYERLQDYRLDRTVRVMRLPGDAAALATPEADFLERYQDCVAAMRTTRERQPVIQFIQ
jgi:hypothetical protein